MVRITALVTGILTYKWREIACMEVWTKCGSGGFLTCSIKLLCQFKPHDQGGAFPLINKL